MSPTFLIRRVVQVAVTLAIISLVVFTVIQLPPGDFLERKIHLLQQQGGQVSQEQAQALRTRYGLDRPFFSQYWLWITRFLQGDLGYSFQHERPVSVLIGERLALTVTLGIAVQAFWWLTAIPLGVMAAVKKYSLLDHVLTFLAFIGLATPSFLLALLALTASVFYFDTSIVGGLFSPEYQYAPWSLGKVVDMLSHAWLPVFIVGAAGTAGLMRIMRGSLIDVLGQMYIQAARARGVSRRRVLFKHALKVAINPLIAIAALLIPDIIAGEILVAVVLNLPTTGPLFLEALRFQDMHLAGALLMFMATMLVVGNLMADVALAWTDPRIRFE